VLYGVLVACVKTFFGNILLLPLSNVINLSSSRSIYEIFDRSIRLCLLYKVYNVYCILPLKDSKTAVPTNNVKFSLAVNAGALKTAIVIQGA